MKYKLKKINKIEKYTDTVYVNDLSVLDDNSYTVNGVCVHNCGCLTTQQTGVGYPMASLIELTKGIADTLNNPAKIVADGGFKKYSDVIKALALGADYVMLGSIFNKALESAGENYVQIKDTNEYMLFDNYLTSFDIFDGGHFDTSNITPENLMAVGSLYKKFRGMSTKEVQKTWGNEVLKTSEGVVKYQQVEYTLSGWVENFEHYLKSAMSYTDSHNLGEFIGEVQITQITENAFKRYNK